jgi:hypothetical protein
MSKDLTFEHAQRHAFDTLAAPTLKNGNKNNFYVDPAQITMPAMLIQELPLTTAQQLIFNFAATNSAPATAVLNNMILNQNDVANMYAIQVLIGYGATRNVRQYYPYGLSVDDDVVYRSQMKMTFETNDLITNVDTNIFRSENGTVLKQYDGAALFNPQRIFTGRTSVVRISIDPGDVSTLGFTPNAYVSVRLWIAKGAAAAN